MLSMEEMMSQTLVLEKTLESPLEARRSNQSILKEINPEYSLKDWCWSWNSRTLAIQCEELIHWERLLCWERLRARGEGDNRGWLVWMASFTQLTWIWVNSGDGEGQGSLAFCCLWGFIELDKIKQLTNNKEQIMISTNNNPFHFTTLQNSLMIFVFILWFRYEEF